MMRKVLTALLSGVIAIAIWSYVVTTVSPNTEVKYDNIPVLTQGEAMLNEQGFMITGMNVSTVALLLEGNRIDLDKLSSSDINVMLDVSKIPAEGIHDIAYSVSFSGDQNTKIISKEPATVSVTIEARESKAVPVEVVYTGNIAKDFMADKENIALDYTEVNITGPKSEVDKIATAQVYVDLEGRSESIVAQYAYTLCDSNGAPVETTLVTSDISHVNMTLKIMRVKEINLLLKVIDGGGATSQNTTIEVSPETIWVSGSDNLLEGLEELEIGTVDLGEISEDQTLLFPIKLPDGITDETGVTEATVNIAFPDLATKTLTVTNITAVNLPAGMEAELLTKALEIQVRGPKDKLESLTAESVSVSVDFTNTESGTVKMKATIVFADPEFGAIGSYTVSATVSEVTG